MSRKRVETIERKKKKADNTVFSTINVKFTFLEEHVTAEVWCSVIHGLFKVDVIG
jgi:hypothetical protein